MFNENDHHHEGDDNGDEEEEEQPSVQEQSAVRKMYDWLSIQLQRNNMELLERYTIDHKKAEEEDAAEEERSAEMNSHHNPRES